MLLHLILELKVMLVVLADPVFVELSVETAKLIYRFLAVVESEVIEKLGSHVVVLTAATDGGEEHGSKLGVEPPGSAPDREDHNEEETEPES